MWPACHVMSCILPVPLYLSYVLWWGSSCIEVCLDVVLSTGTKTDHCFNKQCLLHGECISLPDRYECKCAAGYSGNNCEINNGENEIWVCNGFIFPDYEMIFSCKKTKDKLNSVHLNVVERPTASLLDWKPLQTSCISKTLLCGWNVTAAGLYSLWRL
jgi:hypothetical protein